MPHRVSEADASVLSVLTLQWRLLQVSKLVVNGAGRKGSVGATGSGQNQSLSLSPNQIPWRTNSPLSLFSSFPFLLKEFPTSWRARTSAVTLMREVALLPLAVAVSLPVEPTSAGRACSSYCSNVPPKAPHCCPVLLFFLNVWSQTPQGKPLAASWPRSSNI